MKKTFIFFCFMLFCAFPAQSFEIAVDTESNLNDAQKFEKRMLEAKAQKAKIRKTKRISSNVRGKAAVTEIQKNTAETADTINSKEGSVLSKSGNVSISSGMFIK